VGSVMWFNLNPQSARKHRVLLGSMSYLAVPCAAF
jgi:hypothetical protein